jgi:hypothetical protein
VWLKVLVQVILGLIAGAAWALLFGTVLIWYVDGVVLLVTYIGIPLLVLALLKKVYWFRLTIFLTTVAVTMCIWARSAIPVAG